MYDAIFRVRGFPSRACAVGVLNFGAQCAAPWWCGNQERLRRLRLRGRFIQPDAEMATPASVVVVDEEGDVSLISWGAVIAGGLAAAARGLPDVTMNCNFVRAAWTSSSQSNA